MRTIVIYKEQKYRYSSDTGYLVCDNWGHGKSGLHREIWKDNFGEIPEGCHIHHKDGNKLNNNINNLELIKSYCHLSLHGKENWKDKDRAIKMTIGLEKARELAKVWHKSDEGKEWHKNHYKESLQQSKMYEKKCTICGKIYYSNRISTSLFCGNNCKSKNRRLQKKDSIEKSCVICGIMFKSNKYNNIQTCSLSCGYKKGKQTKIKNIDDKE